MRYLSKEELQDIVTGGVVLGCGGGGDVETNQRLLEQILSLRRRLQIVEPTEIADDAVVAVISGMGSPMATKQKGFDLEQCVKATEILETFTGKKLTHVLAFETGGGNFLPPVYVAAHMGIPFIDGDGVGRAVPEMQMSMYYLYDVASSPTVLTDLDGVSVLITDADARLSEEIGRVVVEKMGGAAGSAGCLMDGKSAKECVIPGTYTRAGKVGCAIRNAVDKGEDPIAALTEAVSGKELIRGRLANLNIETIKAHDVGFIVIQGMGDYEGRTAKVASKNENMIAWDGTGAPIVISPDLPCIVGVDGTVLTNADIAEDMEISLIGANCHPLWRNKAGISLFREVLDELGYSGPYTPFDEL